MEGQLPIAEAIHLFDHQDPEDLVGAQASGAARRLLRAGGGTQILPDQLRDRRIAVEQARHGLQLFGVVKIEPGLTQRFLGFASFAHSGWPLFLG